MNPTVARKTQNNQLLFVKNRLIADNNRQLPTRLQIIKTGVWENSWKGDIEITLDDLLEMKLNFNRGVGLPAKGAEGAPVDYKHEDWDKAAFWIKALEVDESAGILYASEIEWTPAGKEAVLGGEFKFFSPSVYPRSMGRWQNPEDPTETAQNVLLGGGLTNIPFFKGLAGLNASQSPQGGGKENIIYLSNEGETMEVATLRTKKKEDLTAEETAFLVEHKAELSAEEQINLGLETAPAVPAPSDVIVRTDPEAVADPELAALTADIKSGKKVLVDATEYQGLKASADQSAAKLAAMEKKEVEGRVDAHVARGAIKQDQRDQWVGLVLADAKNEDLLKSLEANPLLASELGGDGENVNATSQLRAAATKIVTDSDGKIDLGSAMSQARKENPTLAQQADAEISTK